MPPGKIPQLPTVPATQLGKYHGGTAPHHSGIHWSVSAGECARTAAVRGATRDAGGPARWYLVEDDGVDVPVHDTGGGLDTPYTHVEPGRSPVAHEPVRGAHDQVGALVEDVPVRVILQRDGGHDVVAVAARGAGPVDV